MNVARLAYGGVVLALLVLAWLSPVGEARGQSTCTVLDQRNAVECQGPGEAYAFASGVPQFNPGSWCTVPGSEIYAVFRNGPNAFHKVMNCETPPTETSYKLRAGNATYVGECPGGMPWDEDAKVCMTPCADRPELHNLTYKGEQEGSLVCNAGCQYGGATFCQSIEMNGGEWYGWCDSMTPTGLQCQTGDGNPSPIPPDADGDGWSDDQDPKPNNPGESNSSPQDGSKACGGPNQPECAEDGSNEGSGKGNTSGGGGDCATPPNSSGDAILGQIAYQTWATRCAVEGTPAGGGIGGPRPGEGGEGEQPGWTKGADPGAEGDDTDYVGEQRRFGLGIGPDMLDTENIFGSGSCPSISFTIYGRTISSAMVPEWCQIISFMRAAVLLMGAFTALGILLGRGAV